MILFATIFYQFYSVFSAFLFSVFRHKVRFSNFLHYVIHSIHSFFHRLWQHFRCRNSYISVINCVLRTFLVIFQNLTLNFLLDFRIFKQFTTFKKERAGNGLIPCTLLLYCFTKDGFCSVSVQIHLRNIACQVLIVGLRTDHCAVVTAQRKGWHINLCP